MVNGEAGLPQLAILAPHEGVGSKRQKGQGTDGQGQAEATHMGLSAEEVEAIMVDSEDAGGWHSHIAAALDEEEGGAKHRKGTEETCGGKRVLL